VLEPTIHDLANLPKNVVVVGTIKTVRKVELFEAFAR
jgi:hypothetical protein